MHISSLSPTVLLRYRRSLSIVLLIVVFVSLLHQSSDGFKEKARLLPAKLLPEKLLPEQLKPASGDKAVPLPSWDQWLKSGSASSMEDHPDASFSMKDSFHIRQKLGHDLNRMFDEYAPPIAKVNKSWAESWPVLPSFQVARNFSEEELARVSKGYLADDGAEEEFKAQQQRFKQAIPSWESMKGACSGRGIVMSAGRADLGRIWPLTLLMLRSLNVTLPIEIWTRNQVEYDITLPMVENMRKELGMAISLHSTSHYMSITWDWVNVGLPMIFKVKALAIVYSSFEEIILLDVDSMPVMDPQLLFETEWAKTGLIQWPDFWTNSVSKLMHDTYDFDFKNTLSVESGQMIIDKKKQWEPLVLALYFNWWGPKFFHKLIYLDGMGAGDKDTFWVASAAYQRPFYIVERPVETVRAMRTNGSLWKEGEGILNGAMAQRNPINDREVFFMHLHSPKINMQAPELKGQFDVVFFKPAPGQDIVFANGAEWLEEQLWRNLMWIECESILKESNDPACEGITARVKSLAAVANPQRFFPSGARRRARQTRQTRQAQEKERLAGI